MLESGTFSLTVCPGYSVSYCTCVAPNYGNFLSETFWLWSPPNAHLVLYLQCLILQNSDSVSRSFSTWWHWLIMKCWQVSFKSTRGLDCSSPSGSSCPWALHPPAEGNDRRQTPSPFQLPFWNPPAELPLIPAGSFVIFLFPDPLNTVCCFIFLLHVQQFFRNKENVSPLTCAFGVPRDVLCRRRCLFFFKDGWNKMCPSARSYYSVTLTPFLPRHGVSM